MTLSDKDRGLAKRRIDQDEAVAIEEQGMFPVQIQDFQIKKHSLIYPSGATKKVCAVPRVVNRTRSSGNGPRIKMVNRQGQQHFL
jgi:hypothetical protein